MSPTSPALAVASQSSVERRPPLCCSTSCRHADACDATRGGDPALTDMRLLVERVGPFLDGDRLVQPASPHLAAFSVRSGMAKTVGDGRVLRFHLPGELFGLDIARSHAHATSVVAIGKTWFCRFPHKATDGLCVHNDALADHLRSLRQRERRSKAYVGEGTAAVRMRGMLVDLLDRRRRIEGPHAVVPLPMSRDDIGSYLGMSSATVTRMLAKLRSEGVIAPTADGVAILDEPALRA